ncbi:MAG: EAL domain-containing protein [Lachnospiraceae bacterium]|nr:EAL domain-containing protein [Lachnospiraceae bacterium]
MDGLYHTILDRRELQRIQNDFCAATGIYAFCVGSDGTELTDMSGSDWDKERLTGQIPRDKLMSLLRRVSESSLEDQAIEETEIDALKYAVVCVKEEGKTVLAWLVYAVLSDAPSQEGREFAQDFRYQTTGRQFNLALDLLREISRHMVGDKLMAEEAKAESLRSRSSRDEMEDVLKRMAATTQIVQMLDSDAPIESVLAGILTTVGSFLKIDCAYLYSVGEAAAGKMNVIAEWCNDGVLSGYDQTRNQPRPAYLYRDKPLVLSSASGREGYEEELAKGGIKALAAFPIELKEQIGMYACFEMTRTSRNWAVEEIKFLNDSVKVLQSIITKRIQKNSLAGSYAALEEVLNNVGSSIYVRDKETEKILFANRRLRNIFREELEQNKLAAIFESRVPRDRQEGSMEVFTEDKGSWYDIFYKNIKWVDGRDVFMCSIHDVTEKKMYQKKIERQAYTDFLTGLFNRLCCERDLAKYVDAAKNTGTEGAVLYLDLDDFKHINDSLGHQYGDVLLKSIANGMRKVAGIQNSCYRMGGDEFVIIVPPDQYETLDRIVEGVKAVFARPWFLKNADYYCTMSMGIVHYPTEGEDVQELIRKADIAMYEAKKSGKNRSAVYSNSIKSDSDKRLDMEKNMRDAAIDGYKEFEVYYQPIIDIQENGKCTGAEALIRWNSVEMGFMSPADFIPLAEYLGLINPIGSYVLQQACEACKSWNDNGHPGYKVNVNLSVVQLLQQDIVETVAEIIQKSGINPHNLTLEVTEGLAIDDLERMKAILGQIKELGVRIALDDFGTGYSSLSHIRELPFDVIKVDQSFVRDLAEDNYSKSFIKMVSDLADAIGVSICVEGIETKEQYKVLEGMKVRMIQGYYFDKPMPRAAFDEKYAARSAQSASDSPAQKKTIRSAGKRTKKK